MIAEDIFITNLRKTKLVPYIFVNNKSRSEFPEY